MKRQAGVVGASQWTLISTVGAIVLKFCIATLHMSEQLARGLVSIS